VTNNNIVIIHHPPYSLDLTPTRDFSLFPKLKMKLKERSLQIVSDIQETILKEMAAKISFLTQPGNFPVHLVSCNIMAEIWKSRIQEEETIARQWHGIQGVSSK
jgi:hypothetical protein